MSAPTDETASDPRSLATAAGEVDLAIPNLRQGPFLPSLPCPGKRVGKALYAVDLLSLDRRGPDPQGRRPGTGVGQRLRYLQVHRLKDLQGHRRGSGRAPHPPVGPHLVPLRACRRHLRGRQGQSPTLGPKVVTMDTKPRVGAKVSQVGAVRGSLGAKPSRVGAPVGTSGCIVRQHRRHRTVRRSASASIRCVDCPAQTHVHTARMMNLSEEP